MRKYLNRLNIIFLIHIITVSVVAVGILPRFFIIPLTILAALYALIESTENSALYFARTIPFFTAVPIVAGFDSFNMWRIISGLIFLKWFFKNDILTFIFLNLKQFLNRPTLYIKSNAVIAAIALFFTAGIFSLLVAEDLISGIKRIIYIANLGLIGFVIFWLSRKDVNFSKKLIKNLLVPAVLVTTIGFVQLVSVYFVDIYQFIDFWGKQVQKVWYGQEWSDIAINSNTWFAYFGSQLSLRMFSVFPDSHTFPMFLIFSIPALLAIVLSKVIEKESSWKKMIRTRASLWIVFLPLMYLAAILSGTRGIWLAILGPILFLPFLIKKSGENKNKAIFKYVASFLIIFFTLFLIANPILTSNQFQLEKGDNELLRKRIKSILDFEETSNSGRIYIWKETVKSIIKKPLLGVGIGNFPTVLKQDIFLARAGSSAHNFYLNVAAEMGILGILGALIFLWAVLKKSFEVFKNTSDSFIKIYAGSFLLYFIWILFYSLTDTALFDERAFLIFITNTGLLLGIKKSPNV